MAEKLSESELKELVKLGNYSTRFDELRRFRCAVSLHKYGSASRNFPERVDAIATMELCIKKYRDTHNTEYLLDAANYLMFEFMFPRDKEARFTPTDDSSSAGIVGMSIKEIEDFNNNY